MLSAQILFMAAAAAITLLITVVQLVVLRATTAALVAIITIRLHRLVEDITFRPITANNLNMHINITVQLSNSRRLLYTILHRRLLL